VYNEREVPLRQLLVALTIAIAFTLPAAAEDAKPPSRLNAAKILALRKLSLQSSRLRWSLRAVRSQFSE